MTMKKRRETEREKGKWAQRNLKEEEEVEEIRGEGSIPTMLQSVLYVTRGNNLQQSSGRSVGRSRWIDRRNKSCEGRRQPGGTIASLAQTSSAADS